MRKRFATSSGQPEPVTFFIDRSLGRHVLADALRNAGASVETHDDHFPQDTEDDVWLRAVGRKRWVVLTKDAKISQREIERNALLNFGVRAFVLTAKDLNASEFSKIFVGALPAMNRLLARHAGPFIAKVTRSGEVAVVFESGNEQKE